MNIDSQKYVEVFKGNTKRDDVSTQLQSIFPFHNVRCRPYNRSNLVLNRTHQNNEYLNYYNLYII